MDDATSGKVALSRTRKQAEHAMQGARQSAALVHDLYSAAASSGFLPPGPALTSS